jgi:hypothetical protein
MDNNKKAIRGWRSVVECLPSMHNTLGLILNTARKKGLIPALGKLRQENSELQSSLGYIERPCLGGERIKEMEGVNSTMIY